MDTMLPNRQVATTSPVLQPRVGRLLDCRRQARQAQGMDGLATVTNYQPHALSEKAKKSDAGATADRAARGGKSAFRSCFVQVRGGMLGANVIEGALMPRTILYRLAMLLGLVVLLPAAW